MSDTVIDALMDQLVKIKNEVSLNSSLYTSRELDQINVLCTDIINTVNMNLEHQNYVLDEVSNML